MFVNTCSEWIEPMGTIINAQIVSPKCMPTIITVSLCMKILIDLHSMQLSPQLVSSSQPIAVLAPSLIIWPLSADEDSASAAQRARRTVAANAKLSHRCQRLTGAAQNKNR